MTARQLIRSLPAPVKQLGVVLSNHRGLRRSLLRNYAFRALHFVTPSAAVERDGLWFFVATADRYVSRVTFAYEPYEQHLLARAINILESAHDVRSIRGRTFVDIGANIGTTVIPALKTFGAGRGIAFEPAPENFRLLRCNLTANGIDHLVDAYPFALSERNSLSTLELSAENWGDHRLRTDGTDYDPRRPAVRVRTTTIDELTSDGLIDLATVGLVWMDTQGQEGHILSGAVSLLERAIPVVTEYWPAGLRRSGGFDRFHDLIASNYDRVVDLRASHSTGQVVELPAKEIESLSVAYGEESYTDLVLLKS